MAHVQRITPFLWFADQAEEAAAHYMGIFENSRIVRVTRFGEAGREVHGRPPGSVQTIEFEQDGQRFTALNGGPLFTFSEAISLQVSCDTQAEIDHYWAKLTAGGDVDAQQCGWLKDKYGVSWQVVPSNIADLVADPESAGSQRAMAAMMDMKKLDLAALQRAYDG
jgi:predicted 3-demethylubiquinone-9 3-methyltransferase (glyoxalase superfamily)